MQAGADAAPTGASRQARPEFGPDPHDRPVREVAGAYFRALTSIIPQMWLNPQLPAAAVRRIARARLEKIVRHAALSSPFYRERYRAAGVGPESIDSLEAIQKLPFLAKEDLREHIDDILVPSEGRRDKWLPRGSSGSTGTPVRLFFDPITELSRRLQELRFLRAHGVLPWHSQMIFEGPAHQTLARFLPQRVGVLRRDPFPFWLTPEEAIARVNRERPDVLHGGLSGLRLFAMALGNEPLGYRPRRIFSKGELLDKSTRDLIEAKLRAPLVDYYATEETGIIAWQAVSGGGYCVDADLIHLEIVREDGSPAAPGEIGEIVVTNLYQRAMPILRFRTGDLGALASEPCPAAPGLPLLRDLRGRKLDCIVTPQREIFDPFHLVAILEAIPGLRSYRVAQEREDLLRVRAAWDASSDRLRSEQLVIEKLQELLGREVTIVVEHVDEFGDRVGKKSPLVRGMPNLPLERLTERGYRFRFDGNR
jgi:phenylacetate-coenzyme A ligase PaaK-like adenylate-forming protein